MTIQFIFFVFSALFFHIVVTESGYIFFLQIFYHRLILCENFMHNYFFCKDVRIIFMLLQYPS